MFLSIENLEKRREKYAKAVEVLEFIRKNTLEEAIEKYKKKLGATAAVKELKKTTLGPADAMKKLFLDMKRLQVLTQEDAAIILNQDDSSVINFGLILDDLSALYTSYMSANEPLKKYLQTKLKVLTNDNQIKTTIETESEIISSPKTTDPEIESNRFVIQGKLTVKQFCNMVAVYAVAIVAMISVYFRYTQISGAREVVDAYNTFKIGGNGMFLKQFLDSIISYTNKLSMQVDVNKIKSELEIVETLEKYFDPVTKQYNVATVYEHLLAPLNAMYEEHKDKIDNPEALASLHRLTNFGTFQRFPSNVAMQTKYLHSMSVAANMLKSYMRIDLQDVERSYAEWPFEFEPGATLHI